MPRERKGPAVRLRPVSADVRFELLTRAEVDDRLIEEMLALFGRAFGRWPSLDPEVPLGDHLRWKMESSGAPYAAIVGRVGPRLVVARLVVRQDVRIRGASRTTLFTPDLAVDPEFQGRGISIRVQRVERRAAHGALRSRDRRQQPTRAWSVAGAVAATRRSPTELRALYLVCSPARVPRTVVGRMRVPLPVLRLVLHGAAAVARCRGALLSSPPLAQPPLHGGSLRPARRLFLRAGGGAVRPHLRRRSEPAELALSATGAPAPSSRASWKMATGSPATLFIGSGSPTATWSISWPSRDARTWRRRWRATRSNGWSSTARPTSLAGFPTAILTGGFSADSGS